MLKCMTIYSAVMCSKQCYHNLPFRFEVCHRSGLVDHSCMLCIVDCSTLPILLSGYVASHQYSLQIILTAS
jgi:hypothetical protein